VEIAQPLRMIVSSFSDLGLQRLALAKLRLQERVALFAVTLERPKRLHLVLLSCGFRDSSATDSNMSSAGDSDVITPTHSN
jgi:hypothetical protein